MVRFRNLRPVAVAALMPILILGCAPRTTKYVYVMVNEPKPDQRAEFRPCRLTLGLIQEFGVSGRELADLNYYLESALVLKAVSHRGVSKVTAERSLDLSRRTWEEELVIEHMAKGRATRVWKETQYLYLRTPYKINVHFEDAQNPLTFAPNLDGDYVLETPFWSEEISYGNTVYLRQRPDVEHYLLVDVRILDEIKHDRRTVTGYK